MGSNTGKRQDPETGVSTALNANKDGRAVSVIIFMDPATASHDEGITAPGMRMRPLTAQSLSNPRLVRLAALRLRLDGDLISGHAGTSTIKVDGAERAVLFGRYVNQINARIERVWVRPQVSPGGTSMWGSSDGPSTASTARFKCTVEIEQSDSGHVLEITLVRCDSSPEWQQSLVNAIDAASPLPAPPNRSVFARSLVLNFTSAVPSATSMEAAADPGSTQ